MIGKLLGVYPHEWKRLSVFSISFIVAVGITIGSTAGLSLFVSKFGVKLLPVMFVVTSVVILVAMSAYDAVSGKISNEKLFLVLLGLNATVLVLLWSYIRVGFHPAYLLLYPCYSTITTMSYNHIFVLLYDYFDTQETKRLLPLIASGISLGAFSGGVGVKFLLQYVNTESLLLIWAILTVLAVVPILALKVLKISPVEQEVIKKKKKTGGRFFASLAAEVKSVMAVPLVRILILSTFALTFACDIAYFLSTQIFSQAFPGKEAFASFLGVFTGVSSLIGLIVQVGVLSRLISWMGVARANFVFPGFLLAGFASMLAWPALPAACLIYFSRKFLSYSVGEPVERMLFNSLPVQIKGRAASFIKGYVAPVSTACASLLIIAITFSAQGSAAAFFLLAGAGFLISYSVIYMKIRMKREYTRSLISLIKDRHIDLKQLSEDWKAGDKSELSAIPVAQYLASDDDTVYAMMLEFIASLETAQYVKQMKAVLFSKSLEMQIETVKVMVEVDGENQFDYLLELAHGEHHARLRALCIRLLGQMNEDDINDELVIFIHNPDETIQSAAIISVFQSGDIFHMAEALTILKQMLSDDDEGTFKHGIHILLQIGDRRFIRTLGAFLSQRSEIHHADIIHAMTVLETGEDAKYVNYFCELLNRTQGLSRGYVIDAIAKIASEAAIPPLINTFRELNATNQLKAIAALGAMGSVAIDNLVDIVSNFSYTSKTRLACLAELDPLETRQIGAHLKKLGKDEINHIFMLIRLRMRLQHSSKTGTLFDLVVEEMINESICVWLHIIARKTKKPVNVIMLAEPLLGGSRAVRADAMETLENLIAKVDFQMISPVLKQFSDAERMAAATNFIALENLSIETLYEKVADRSTPWHFACLLSCMDADLFSYDADTRMKLVEKAFGQKDFYCDQAALMAISDNGGREDFSALVAFYLQSPDKQLFSAAQRVLENRSNGGEMMLSTFRKSFS